MRWSAEPGKMEFKEVEKRKLILENVAALLLEFYCGESAFFLRKALIPYSPELAAGQMVRFLFLACEAPENNGSFPLVHHVPENYGAGGAADERNWLYYKMWGSSTAYRGGVGCLFFFFAKRILQMKKYFGTFFSRLFFKVFARLERRYYNRL